MNITQPNPYRDSVYERAERWKPIYLQDWPYAEIAVTSLRHALSSLRDEGVPEATAYWAGQFIATRSFTYMQAIETEQNITATQQGALQRDYAATVDEAQATLQAQYARREMLREDIADQDDVLQELQQAYGDPLRLALDSIAAVYARYRPTHKPTDNEADVWQRELQFNHRMRRVMLEFFTDRIDGVIEFVGHYGTISSLLGRLPGPHEHLTLSEAKRAFREIREFKRSCDNGYYEFEGIISSPLARAWDTARIIARVFGFATKDTVEENGFIKKDGIIILEGLAERWYGEKYIGRPYSEIDDLAGPGNVLVTAVGDKNVLIDDDMETPDALREAARATKVALIRLCKNKKMIVVGHRSKVRVLLEEIPGLYQAFTDTIQSPPLLKPGARITLSLNNGRDSTDEFSGKDVYIANGPPEDPIWGTRTEQIVRHMYERAIHEDNLGGIDLLQRRYYAWKCPVLDMDAILPPPNRFFNEPYSKLDLWFRDPYTHRIMIHIARLNGDRYWMKINHGYRRLFPELQQVPVPPPVTTYAGGSYNHSWWYGWEAFSGSSQALPLPIQALRDRLVLLAGNTVDDMLAGKEHQGIQDMYCRKIFGESDHAKRVAIAELGKAIYSVLDAGVQSIATVCPP